METHTQKNTAEIATLAGGCFWGMEDLIRKLPGVLDTEVGYSGGETKNAVYRDVKNGKSGHAEAIQIKYDPRKISFAEILDFFFRMHDPTTLNRQGNDIGSQYRSAIFYHSDRQKKHAEKMIELVNKSGNWKLPVVTEVVHFDTFWAAEPEHQDYLANQPNGYTCHYVRPLKSVLDKELLNSVFG
jgi:peptide-methionine (S)-S-oxide reductase